VVKERHTKITQGGEQGNRPTENGELKITRQKENRSKETEKEQGFKKTEWEDTWTPRKHVNDVKKKKQRQYFYRTGGRTRTGERKLTNLR
jgi:hypothetical protein